MFIHIYIYIYIFIFHINIYSLLATPHWLFPEMNTILAIPYWLFPIPLLPPLCSPVWAPNRRGSTGAAMDGSRHLETIANLSFRIVDREYV